MTPAQLRLILPKAPSPWLDALCVVAPKWGIDTPLREAHFVAQLAHECAQFTRLEENLNYGAARILTVWPSRFPLPGDAIPYAHNPEKLANRVYSNRLGNGVEESGDGWRYRGRGPIQITGRANYKAAGDAIGLDLVETPEAVLRPVVGCDVAGWFWQSKKLNSLADVDNIRHITMRINGGSHGMEERRGWLNRAKSILRAS
jgi:putative chitinase